MPAANRVEVVRGDITAEPVDAIVNAANTDLLLGSGVAGAIRLKGGPAIQDECRRIGPIGLGEAALTGGGALPAKYVIHAASMRLGGAPTADSISRALLNSLKIAAQQKFTVVSIPAIGTGIGGFPVEEAAALTFKVLSDFLPAHRYPERIRVVLYDDRAYDIFSAALKALLRE
jgi:O-acetyl-ADP-ribose deacetylase (regulator of RNase III)